MDDLEKRIHRGFVESLIAYELKELAASVIDAEISVLTKDYQPYGVAICLPPASGPLIRQNEKYETILRKAARNAAQGHVTDQNGNPIEELQVEFRMMLQDASDDKWKEVARRLITSSNINNQALITKKAAAKHAKPVYEYNELHYASSSEIRIAQELEARKVLFFPLAVAVRADSGDRYDDHREVDFLVCRDGSWGILEVSYHPDRFEKDSEKDAWFKKSGILCIEHRSSEQCYSNPKKVVDEFLEILEKHKR